MHIQVITLQLTDMSDEQFRALSEELAPAFAELSGLISKVWLADPATNTYGGVYTWENRAACEAFATSDLFNAVASHPNFTGVTSRDFAVIDAPTRVTRGLVAAAV